MTTISDIFNNVLLIESEDEIIYDDDVMIKEYFLREAFNKRDIEPAIIIRWELQLAKFIFNLHKNGSFPAAINISSLMVDCNLNIIASSIEITKWNTHRPIEVGAVGTVSKTNDALFEYILNGELSPDKNRIINLLYILNTYYCAASVQVNKKYILLSYINSIEHFYNMVDSGFIESLYKLFACSNKTTNSNKETPINNK